MTEKQVSANAKLAFCHSNVFEVPFFMQAQNSLHQQNSLNISQAINSSPNLIGYGIAPPPQLPLMPDQVKSSSLQRAILTASASPINNAPP